MALTSGTRLGPYEVLSPLGAGGMGEVWRARDAKLGRQVAIKVLPPGFAADPDRLARFDREARALAALNHPNIAVIYGLEDAGETPFLVLELVPGETLAERLAAGPLPIDEALAVCRQVAEALESAHASGIIHRDLKPANIKVTPSGKAKVLDFGLAKALAGETGPAPDLSHSPTVTSGGTAHGVVLGTASYMSPEQARGKPVDRRTDIWSFGCVLFETLSGRRAFDGETVSDVMVSVLTREPDWSALPPGLPFRVRETIRRCLRRDPERRLHDIADARLELEDAVGETASGPTAPPAEAAPSRRTFRWTLLAVAAVSAALAGLAVWLFAGSRAAAAPPRVGELARITLPLGHSEWPTWSPDGNLIAYSSDRDGNFEIYVRRGEHGQDVNITNDPGQDVQPAFSPDGNSIAFVSTRSSKTGLIKIGGAGFLTRESRTFGGDLWLAPSLGGPARRLAPDANFPVWRPDGRHLLYVSGRDSHRSILDVSAEGGAPRAVLPASESQWEIVRIGCSPDGRWVSFEDGLLGVFLMPAAGGKPVRVLSSGFSHSWNDSSRRLWNLVTDPNGGTRIQSSVIDLDRAAPVGTPTTVGLVPSYLRDLAVSRDERHLVVVEEDKSRNLTRLPLAAGGTAPAGPEEQLTTGRVLDDYPQVSPDNRWIAYVSDTLGRTEVWLLDLETRRRSRLQLPGEALGENQPTWMPNGKELILVRVLSSGENAGWIAALDGSRTEELFRAAASHGIFQFRVSPTGDSLLSTELAGTERLKVFDLASRKRTPVAQAPPDTFDVEWSPDGRWIALTASDGNALQLFRMPVSGGPPQQLTTGYERMRHPFFSPDGKWIYIQPSHRNIFRVRAEGGPLEQVTRFPEAGLFLEEPTISRDGRYLFYARENGQSTLWLLTLENEASRR